MHTNKNSGLGMMEKPGFLAGGPRVIRLAGYLSVLAGYLILFFIAIQISPMGPQMNQHLAQYLQIDTPAPSRAEPANLIDEMRLRGEIEGLTKALNDSDPNIRMQSAIALGGLLAGKGKISNRSLDPRFDALEDLKRVPVQPVTPLIRTLNDTRPDVRAEAASALGKIMDRMAVQPLVYLLYEDDDPRVRARAAEALGSINYKAGSEYELRQALDDDDLDVVNSTEAALTAMGLDPYPAPLTGTTIKGRYDSTYDYEGYRLAIKNDGEEDAIYELYHPDGVHYHSVFIRSGDTHYVHETQITSRDQTYRIAGDKWSNSRLNFTRNFTRTKIYPVIIYRSDS